MTVNVLCPSGHSWDCEACRYCEEGRGTLRAHMTCKREVSPVYPPTLSQLTQSHSTLGAGRQLVTHTSDSDWDISTWFCQPAQSTVIYVRSGIAAYVGFANIAIAAWNWTPSYLWPSLNFRKFTIWICFFEWIHHTIEIIWVGGSLAFICLLQWPW